jgi:hypothetical protein
MMQNNIPKIIHQIAPADKSRWHPIWEKCYPTWQKHFPEFEHKMWNDGNDIDNFVRDYYPQYLEKYLKFEKHISRIEFVRFCLLHHFGGIYADMDMFCYRNFEDYIDKHKTAILGDDIPLMWSSPNENFWVDCCDFYSNATINFSNIETGNKLSEIKTYDNDEWIHLLPEKSQKILKINMAIIENTIKYSRFKNTKIHTLPYELFDGCSVSEVKKGFTTHLYTGTWIPDYQIQLRVDIEFFKKTHNDS